MEEEPDRMMAMDIEQLLTEFRKEVDIAIGSFFAWKSIRNVSAGNNDLLMSMNENARTWNTILHSLSATFFIAIGRIFDRDGRSLTVHRFLRDCRGSLDQFSKSSLASRRIAGNKGVKPDYLDEYMKTLYEPSAQDFLQLEAEADSRAAIYRARYEPIRHKIMAHKDFATIGSTDALFAQTNIGEVEELLGFLHGLEKVVWELFANGRLTKISDHRFEEERDYLKDAESLLRKIQE